MNTQDYPTKKLKRIRRAIIVIAIILIVAIGAYASNTRREKEAGEVAGESVSAKPVRVITVGDSSANRQFIETSGVVTPAMHVDILALGRGTLRSLGVDVGDEVAVNQRIASLHDNNVATGYNNAKTNVTNLQNSLSATERLADESLRQAELSVSNAREAEKSAAIRLKDARDTLANTDALLVKQLQDAYTNAITSFYTHASTAETALEQVNFIIKAEGNEQISGIAPTLSIQDLQALITAKNDYAEARTAFSVIENSAPTPQTVEHDLRNAVNALSAVHVAVDDTVRVLNNTIASSQFSDSALETQKTAFRQLRTTVLNALSAAETALQHQQNIQLQHAQQRDTLQNNVNAAENALRISQISLSNALAALRSAERAKEQQLIGAQTSLDNARGQLYLAAAQLSDLEFRAPISGIITKRYVDPGAEVSPGQKIAEISQTSMVKIVAAIPSSSVYRISLGNDVRINDSLRAAISRINPSADPISRKVGIEIVFDNSNNELISQTSVRLRISTTNGATQERNAVVIPLKAVTITQSEQYVFVVREGVAHKSPVTLGAPLGDAVEILSGLSENDVLVIEGNKLLIGGDVVSISQ